MFNLTDNCFQSYYNVYGGTNGQYPIYGASVGAASGMVAAAGAAAAAAFYPYLNMAEGGHGSYATGQSYGVYPHHLYQYAAMNSSVGYPQQYGTPDLSRRHISVATCRRKRGSTIACYSSLRDSRIALIKHAFPFCSKNLFVRKKKPDLWSNHGYLFSITFMEPLIRLIKAIQGMETNPP
ncbi:putative BOULE/DAZ family protein [Helianthus annuus]|nr:putative BOULE/DAZ family protein [Helianthus annuus]